MTPLILIETAQSITVYIMDVIENSFCRNSNTLCRLDENNQNSI